MGTTNFDVVAANAFQGPSTGAVDGVLGGNTPAAATVTTLAAQTSTTIGSATPTAITNVRVYSQAITPSAVSAATAAEQTFTVTGLTTADKVIVNGPANSTATALASARVSAANTLALTYVNPTAGSLTPTAGTIQVIAIRS